ncbi:conserved hypothetical protein [Neospora caninum Liverpool]|uniref:Transmembrane protein n=1 Tax=Neospora caninum (strain Liverpool) TaxID=572307 RepID=F0VDJ1_NEOCL|nr:conserved hypothetical protein [Neospora caninum Liverpool]CBZ51784.1 conserved hypothetical protein [Neospora caninum Liverpool]CEL65741.1 TPA: hypothetical protein BN1204_015760 [Neospora caninum Liverpool]|eukprot:XP_003881817.1 conserved hypothetical protein [Neospora caninum Liverpool]
MISTGCSRRPAALIALAALLLLSSFPSLRASESLKPPAVSSEDANRLHVIGFVTLDQLVSSLKDASLREAFLAALPNQWALPKFASSTTSELNQLQIWTKSLRERILPGLPLGEALSNATAEISSRTSSLQDVLSGLAESAGTDRGSFLPSVFSGDLQGNLPSILKEFTSAFPLRHGSQGEDADSRPALHSVEDALGLLPRLDLLNTGHLSQIFAVPSELAWPVSRQRLELLLPVLTRSPEDGESSLPGWQVKDFDGLSALRVQLEDLLVPLSQADGSLLFASLSDVLPDFQLPAKLDILPLATLENKELGSVTSLWSSVKGTMLSRMAVLSGDAPFLVGPVLNLNSLSKLQLASSSPLVQRLVDPTMPLKLNSTLGNPADLLSSVLEALDAGVAVDDGLKDLFANRAIRLQEAVVSPVEALLRPNNGTESNNLSELLEQSRSAVEQLSAHDFLNDYFFSMKLPFVAVPRDSLPGLFTSLKNLNSRCGDAAAGEAGASCPLTFPSFSALSLGAPLGDEGLEAMYLRVESLSEQLRLAVEQLQERVMRTLSVIEPSEEDKPATEKKVEETKDAVALRQAMDATVKLANTMTAALQFTKKEVKALQLFSAHSEGGLRAGALFEDLGSSAAHLLKQGGSGGSPAQLRSFIANIEGNPLLAVPRTVYNQLLRVTAGEQEPQRRGQQATTSNVRRRRLQVTEQTPPAYSAVAAMVPREDGLVLVDPHIFGSLLNNLHGVDGAGLRGALKDILSRATQGSAAGSDEARPLFSLPPLVEDLFANNTLALPTLAFPTADLLRTGVFPGQLLNVPLGQWVSSGIIPADFAGRTLPELLDVHSAASQLKALPLGELLPGARAAAASLGLDLPTTLFEDGSGLLARTVGDLQMNALLPPQLLHIPLSQLVDGNGAVGRDILDLPLGSVLAGGEAAASLLTQPLGDALGLRTALESLTNHASLPLKFELPDIARAAGISGVQEHLPQLLSASGLPGAVALLPVSGEWLSLAGLDKIRSGGGAAALVGNVAEIAAAAATAATSGSFLPGRGGASSASLETTPGLLGKRPLGDALKNLTSLTGSPLGNELFF